MKNRVKEVRVTPLFAAIDSFKGSLSTHEANRAMKEALLRQGAQESDIHLFPMTDGGEGFVQVVHEYVKGDTVTCRCTSPLGHPTEAKYLMAEDGTAYIESASACGYTLVPQDQKDPFNLTSYGLGELIHDAVSKGARKLVIGLGGTSTCDGGVGLLQALGVRFHLAPETSKTPEASTPDATTSETLLPPAVPALLKPIVAIDATSLATWSTPVEIWVDTQAHFHGTTSAVRMYGPQKGLRPEHLAAADLWMAHLATLYDTIQTAISNSTITSDAANITPATSPSSTTLSIESPSNAPGTGAAGGLGGALHALLGARILTGADQIIHLSRFREHLAEALKTAPDHHAIVITGEGKLDAQTLTGKLPSRIALAAKAVHNNVRTICVCGRTDLTTTSSDLFDEIIPITPPDMPLADAMNPSTAYENMSHLHISLD